jgi:hypothetical protein
MIADEEFEFERDEAGSLYLRVLTRIDKPLQPRIFIPLMYVSLI